MWPEIFEFGRQFFSVLCCCVTVKLLDDYLDKDVDSPGTRKNWIHSRGESVIAYALVFFAVAAALDAAISVTLFLGSYIIGMFNDFDKRYPSLLYGWQESLCAFGAGLVLLGWRLMVFGVFITFAVQLIDDVIDVALDHSAGIRNLAHRWGQTECVIIGLLNLFLAWWIGGNLFFPVSGGIVLFYVVTAKLGVS